MTFSIKYKPLFQVNILHAFFLNKGMSEYVSMDIEEKSNTLDSYDISEILQIVPTQKTAQVLNGHNLIFKATNTGFTIWSKVTGDQNDIPFIQLDGSLEFTFSIIISDEKFYNYTHLIMENENKLYYFSNRRLEGESGTFPLINNENDNNFINEDYILSDEGVKLLSSQLNLFERAKTHGLITIFVEGQTSDNSLTNAEGKIQDPYKKFEILYENRKTTWRYIFAEDQKVKKKDDVKKENGDSKKLITKEEQPLTQKGFVSIELGGIELPNPVVNFIKPNDSNTKYYSEIYM